MPTENCVRSSSHFSQHLHNKPPGKVLDPLHLSLRDSFFHFLLKSQSETIYFLLKWFARSHLQGVKKRWWRRKKVTMNRKRKSYMTFQLSLKWSEVSMLIFTCMGGEICHLAIDYEPLRSHSQIAVFLFT